MQKGSCEPALVESSSEMSSTILVSIDAGPAKVANWVAIYTYSCRSCGWEADLHRSFAERDDFPDCRCGVGLMQRRPVPTGGLVGRSVKPTYSLQEDTRRPDVLVEHIEMQNAGDAGVNVEGGYVKGDDIKIRDTSPAIRARSGARVELDNFSHKVGQRSINRRRK